MPVRVIVESPYAGDVESNVSYAQAAMRDSLARGEAPFASHLLYPQVLDDSVEEQRTQGLDAAASWYPHADILAVYVDRGISPGMQRGVAQAIQAGLRIRVRSLRGLDTSEIERTLLR